MKAVILIGGISKWLYPLSQQQPRAMLQVGNVPALRHNLQSLRNWGVTEFCIPVDMANTSVQNYFTENFSDGIKIRYAYTKKFLGTAGCLRLFEDTLSDGPFLIANGNNFSRPDLSPLLDISTANAPFLNIGIYEPQTAELEPVAKEPQRGHQPERRTSKEPANMLAHMYYADPAIMQWIPADRYFDLREQLVPALRSNGYSVRNIPLNGRVNELRSFDDYLEANHDIARGTASKTNLRSANIRISKKASVHGPVIIGQNTVIGPHCVIVGPAVIGSNCRIGRGVFIHRSVIDSNVRIQTKSHVQESIVLEGSNVQPGSHLLKAIGVNGVQFPPSHKQLFRSSRYTRGWKIHHTTHNSPLARRRRITRNAARYHVKRFLDVGLTLLFSPLLVPPVVLLGLLVRWTSKGPAFFKETRTGQNGKEFKMYKLRTMIHGAHLQQAVLQRKTQGDGPMFKLEDDPRVTPLGRFLRKTSLDELPQFWNVFKGDMSLVGPRPLAEREMKWNRSWKEMRLLVKPGITGLWQVNTGVYSDFSDWILYDMHYVLNCSLKLDLKILFLTVARVFQGRKSNFPTL